LNAPKHNLDKRPNPHAYDDWNPADTRYFAHMIFLRPLGMWISGQMLVEMEIAQQKQGYQQGGYGGKYGG
jgi:hypothetical protein